MSTTTTPILRATGLAAGYGGPDVVHGIDLDVTPGAPPVGIDLDVEPCALEDVLDDRERLLGARVVRGHDHVVGALERDPARVAVAPPASPLDAIEQRVVFVDQAEKRHLLVRLLKDRALHQVLVFTRTKRRAEMLARQLRAAKIDADAIHGNKS